jgi:hypothetical protein
LAADNPPPAGKKNLSPALRFWRRIGIAIGGGLLVLAGVILSLPLVPGPGFAVILLGLGVLSLEFERPRKWMAALKHRFKDLAQRVRGKSSSGD